MSETEEHLGWLKQYLGAMTAENWKDMRDYAERQVDQLSVHLARTPSPDGVREALEIAKKRIGYLTCLGATRHQQRSDDIMAQIDIALAALSKPAGKE